MLCSKLLHCPALVLALFGARPVEPTSLGVELQHHVKSIKSQPLDNRGNLPIGQEIVEEFRAMLDLIVTKVPEFIKNYAAHTLTLGLGSLPRFPYPMEFVGGDYAHFCRQDYLGLLGHLGHSYHGALNSMSKILRLWREHDLGSLDALANFLKVGIEAMQMSCKMIIYSEVLVCPNPGPLQNCQDDDQEAAMLIAEGIEKIKQTVHANYETMSNSVGGLLERMIEGLMSILNGLEGRQRYQPYVLFKDYLEHCFEKSIRFSPGVMKMKERDGVFKTDDRKMPSEVLALFQVRIFASLLEFKLHFPDLVHHATLASKLFPIPVGPEQRAFFEGPPLINISMGLRWFGIVDASSNSLEEGSAELSAGGTVLELENWIFSLYYWIPSDEHPVFPEGTKKWLSDVEENLCMMLKIIESADKRLGLYALGCLIGHLESMAVMIEQRLGKLYGTMQLGRREGEPGHFSAKLKKVIQKVLSDDSSMEGGHSTRASESGPLASKDDEGQ